MAIIRITTPSIADDAIDNTKLDLADDYTFTGTVEGAGGGIFESQLLHVRDEKASGTAGGTNIAGDQTRVINTVVTNEITGASLSSNQITLPSGTFYIQASSSTFQTDVHRLFLYNTNDSSVEILGTSSLSNDNTQSHSHSFIKGRFTINSSKTFEIRHYMQKVMNNIGLGANTGDSRVNIYTDVQIWKVA